MPELPAVTTLAEYSAQWAAREPAVEPDRNTGDWQEAAREDAEASLKANDRHALDTTMRQLRRLTAAAPLGGAVSGPTPVRRATGRRVERSLGRSLAILSARRDAGFPCADYQLLVQTCWGGPGYLAFKAGWDKWLRAAGGQLRLSTDRRPATLAAESRASITLPLSPARHRAQRGRYTLALEPGWAVTDDRSIDLEVWLAANVDAWIKWMFTALSSRTARVAQPVIELALGPSGRPNERWPLSVRADWPLAADQEMVLSR